MPKKMPAWVAKIAFVVLLLSVASGSALADPSFTITGSTTGQFSLLGIPLGNSIGNSLTFTGTDFGPTTATPGADLQVNLGTFDLSTWFMVFDPFDFKLNVNFTAPSTGGTVFTADLSGLVTVFGGYTTVNFVDNGPRHFSFAGDQGSGSFDLYLSDVRVYNNSQVALVGSIRNISANPEPAALALTGAFMGGMLLLFRKRLRRS